MRRPPFSILIALSAVAVFSGCASTKPGSPSPGAPTSGTAVPSGSQPVPAPTPAPTPKTTAPTPATALPSSTGSTPLPAPDSTRTASSSGSGSAQTGPAQTPEERRAAIDRNLEGSLGTFDEKLRKEQEVIAQERDAREAEAAATPADSTETEDSESGSATPENPAVDGSSEKKSDAAARPGDLKSEKDKAAATNGAPTGNGSSIGNIPDGSDDDIVARRLRKAAEQETDPELKEKLWKEYIEYKKNTGT